MKTHTVQTLKSVFLLEYGAFFDHAFAGKLAPHDYCYMYLLEVSTISNRGLISCVMRLTHALINN